MTDQQLHVQEQERDFRASQQGSELFNLAAKLGQMHLDATRRAMLDTDPIPLMDHRGYSVESLREVCDHLSWQAFSEGELNQINRIAIILQAQVRSRYAARRAEEKEAKRLEIIAHPERFTPLQREDLDRGGRYPASPITGERSPYVGD